MVYYVKVSVKELSKSANYSSDFFWLLERYDGEISGEVIPMSTSEYISNGDGTYSVRYKGADIDVANVSTDSSYKIENVWTIPNNFGSAPVTKVIPGDDLPANTKVVIGDNVTTIEDGTFHYYWDEEVSKDVGSTGLVEIVLGDGFTEIPQNCFAGCSNLRNITFGENVSCIGINSFSGTDFTTFVVPSSVISIGGGAFTFCNNLKYFYIPKEVEEISLVIFAVYSGCETVIYCEIDESEVNSRHWVMWNINGPDNKELETHWNVNLEEFKQIAGIN